VYSYRQEAVHAAEHAQHVYVTTWSTNVTSVIHCRYLVTFLFYDCNKLRVRSV